MRINNSKPLIGLFTILIVLMPLLSVYAFPGIASLTLGEPLLLVCTTVLLIKNAANINNKGILIYAPLYWIFIIYVVVVSIINTAAINEYSLTDTVTTSLRLLLYTTVIFMLAKDHIDFALLRRTYLIICFVCSLYLIVQFIFGSVFKVYLPSTFSNLKIMYSNYTGATYNDYLYDSYRRLLFRPSSFFKEPSHLSRYIIYALPIITFKKGKKSRFEIINFMTVLLAVLITRSAMGFLGIGVFMVVWLLFNRKSSNSYTRLGVYVVILGLIAASAYYGLADQAVGRLSINTGSGGSRIYRGFSIFSQMKPIFKIFGSGLGNYSAFASHYNISTVYDIIGDSGNSYMNLIATTLVSSGIFGLILYISSLLKLVWKKSESQIACFALFIFFAFGTNIYYYSAEYILPLLFMTFNVNMPIDET